jgi:hypothetical protein
VGTERCLRPLLSYVGGGGVQRNKSPFLAQVTNGCIIATGDTVTTQNELDQIRAIVADTLDALGVEPEPDPSAVLSQRFLARDKTTAWARDFHTEEELAAWCCSHVRPAPLRQFACCPHLTRPR